MAILIDVHSHVRQGHGPAAAPNAVHLVSVSHDSGLAALGPPERLTPLLFLLPQLSLDLRHLVFGEPLLADVVGGRAVARLAEQLEARQFTDLETDLNV